MVAMTNLILRRMPMVLAVAALASACGDDDAGGNDAAPDDGTTEGVGDADGREDSDAAADADADGDAEADVEDSDAGGDAGSDAEPDAADGTGDGDAGDGDGCSPVDLSFNQGGTVGTAVAGSDAIYVISVTPGTAFDLHRVEFTTGEPSSAGSVTVHVYADVDGAPSGPALGVGTFAVDSAIGWQGADLEPPVLLEAATTVWVSFEPGVDLRMPQAASGTGVPYTWGFSFGEWIFSGEAFWMLRLLGCGS